MKTGFSEKSFKDIQWMFKENNIYGSEGKI